MQGFTPQVYLSAYQCGGLVLGAGDIAGKKIDENLIPHEANNLNGWSV